MGKDSHIEWTDNTFNPWIGCTKVSPGCANCYAASSTFVRAQRSRGTELWGKGQPRWKTSEANWRKPLAWNREVIEFPFECSGCAYRFNNPETLGNPWACPHCGVTLTTRRRPRVFCASLADWLDDEVPIEWLADLLQLIHDTPNLDWLLLTKRPENWRARLEQFDWEAIFDDKDYLVARWFQGFPPQNVWIGTTVEDQKRADERIPALLKIPARVRFLSCEPLLERVDLGDSLNVEEEFHHSEDCSYDGCALSGGEFDCAGQVVAKDSIHWVICGGESGPKARPMHPDWARALLDQCQAAGVPFFFKQWGEWMPNGQQFFAEHVGKIIGKEEHRFDGATFSVRLGKKTAGRLIDGREWNEVPA